MEQVLRVGASVKLKRSFFGRSWALVYAGMPGPDVFSLVVSWSVGYHSAAYNLFLPKDERELEVAGQRLVFGRVAPEELRFRFGT